LIIQDALLGMNAHINYDLAFASEKVKLSPQHHEPLPRFCAHFPCAL